MWQLGSWKWIFLSFPVFNYWFDIFIGTVYRACSAIFTFVSLNESHRPIEVPPLQLITEAEKLRFEVGKQRYLKKKEQRQKEQTVVRNVSVDGLWWHTMPQEIKQIWLYIFIHSLYLFELIFSVVFKPNRLSTNMKPKY